ncbi:terminase gpP N-terminus-related DNA-binding protein [Alistipes sp.]|uniref:terminase gpP N-terminus-related DNA-binding protein n=1 Tax=Alistipes sp. TaxID=1872444 RepID=UPI003AF0CC4B
MTKMTSEQMRRWALSMYLNESRTQAEIAEACGVSRQTIIRWAKADHWDEHKASLTMTREEQIKNLQRQIVEINNTILDREQGQRFATPKEADTIAKLTTAINKLETELGIHEVVSTAQRFIAWLRPVDLELTKTFTRLFDKFIKSLM